MDARLKFNVPYKISDEWFYAWAGDVPDNWDVKRGKYVFNYKKEINKNNKCDLVLALTLIGVIKKEDLKERSLVPSDYATYQIFEPNNLVFKLIDLENFQTSRVGIVPERGIMSSAYIRLVPTIDVCIEYFFYYYFALYLQGVYNFLGMGVRSTLNYGDLLNIPLIVPPIEDQIKIANYLRPFADQIRKIEIEASTRIELLKNYKTSVFYNAVTGKIKI